MTILYQELFHLGDQTTKGVALGWIETPPDLIASVLLCFQHLFWLTSWQPHSGLSMDAVSLDEGGQGHSLAAWALASFHSARLYLELASHAWCMTLVQGGLGRVWWLPLTLVSSLLQAHALWRTDSWSRRSQPLGLWEGSAPGTSVTITHPLSLPAPPWICTVIAFSLLVYKQNTVCHGSSFGILFFFPKICFLLGH